MCGIAGIVNSSAEPVDQELLFRMNASQSHRGPDQEGIYIDGGVGLAHRRLSIVDLRDGRQPIANEDGSVFIIFNGEIYNSPELRAELRGRGHVFATATDTEVMVHLYEECGREMLGRLNGMFALAIYDKRRRRLLLARDRMGQKPLLYFMNGGSLVFASEFVALGMHPDMPRELNYQAIYDYFSLQYIPAPDTAFSGVRKLPPAHALEMDIDSGRTDVFRYWKLDFSAKTDLDFDDACEKLRELMSDAVRKRLMADVPYGAFLSGGIDSTIIAGLMSGESDQPVNTFTVGFDEKLYDERQYARLAVEHINGLGGKPLICHERVVDPGDFDTLSMLIRHYGEPYSDASMLPTFLLSRFTREHVTVAMSGDGADELFAGYNRYLLMRMMRGVDALPVGLRRKLSSWCGRLLPDMTEERSLSGKMHRLLRIAAASPEERYLSIIDRFPEALKQRVCGELFRGRDMTPTLDFIDRIMSGATAADPVEKLMETDIGSYLYGDVLTKVDIASMAASLEVRSPFMDYRVVEFAASLPLAAKLRQGSRKYILRKTFGKLIPPELGRRGKAGFGVPLAVWFRRQWRERVTERLLDGNAVGTGFLDRGVVEEMLAEHGRAAADHSYPLFSMLVLELFLSEGINAPGKTPV